MGLYRRVPMVRVWGSNTLQLESSPGAGDPSGDFTTVPSSGNFFKTSACSSRGDSFAAASRSARHVATQVSVLMSEKDAMAPSASSGRSSNPVTTKAAAGTPKTAGFFSGGSSTAGSGASSLAAAGAHWSADASAASAVGVGGAGAVSAASSWRAFGESRAPICWRVSSSTTSRAVAAPSRPRINVSMSASRSLMVYTLWLIRGRAAEM